MDGRRIDKVLATRVADGDATQTAEEGSEPKPETGGDTVAENPAGPSARTPGAD
jgi:hypothetical protein